MNNVRNLIVGFATVLATIAGASTAAHASRKMLVLIDASGSMSTVRADSTTRFDAAKSRAVSQIANQAATGLDGVAVYTFSDITSTAQTVGFVDPNTAILAIQGLDLFTVGGGNTPLAGSLCDAVDVLSAEPATQKILELASDGEENFTPMAHQCFGPPSMDSTPPYTGGSWQNNVYIKVSDASLSVQIDLFDPGPITGLAARAAAAHDPEASITAKTRLMAAVAAAAAGDGPPSLTDFFTQVALVSGGRLTVIEDTVAQLPVFADVNGNSCVDRSDALLIARAFGQSGPPQSNPLDLDLDGKVGFADYALALAHFTPGGCGTADPYVPRAPIVCSGLQPVVISGQTIADGGITIDARIACQLVIRNSLIVSGKNAINVLGTAVITVDNSILVGEGAVLSSQGATLLSASKTIFHGKRSIVGALAYIDRGGNIWE
jgi:VWA domain-containing protein